MIASTFHLCRHDAFDTGIVLMHTVNKPTSTLICEHWDSLQCASTVADVARQNST